MAELVALALDGGPAFVRALQKVWEQGDAAFPVDQRLPEAERKRVMAAIAPGAIIEADGERRSLSGGIPMQDGDALVIATSGTTGMPKGVVHTHASIASSAWATSKALGVNPTSDQWLACLPLAHIGGLSVVTRALITGTALEVQSGFDADAVISSARSGSTLVSLVTRALGQIDSTLFRTILIGGAAPPPQRPQNVIATYGMTETGSGVVYNGKPLDEVEIRIDSDQEIWLRGPMMLRCYRHGALTRAATVEGADPKDNDGWLPTGDLGALTTAAGLGASGEATKLQVFGRRGDVIVTGAEKVWPARVEPLLNLQPGVAEAVVVGRPHHEWGHQVAAVIVAQPGQQPDLRQIREAVKDKLPAWYAPQTLELVTELPKTPLGKVRRDRL